MQVLYPSYVDMLRHLRSTALNSFKTRLENGVKEASKQGFEASIDLSVKHVMRKFEKGCKGNAM
jgi:hypothetical protein